MVAVRLFCGRDDEEAGVMAPCRTGMTATDVDSLTVTHALFAGWQVGGYDWNFEVTRHIVLVVHFVSE